MDQITTLGFLVTNAGATALVLLIVQYTKEFIPQWFHTRLYTLLWSFVVLMTATAFVSPTAERFVLAAFNSFIVASSAMGLYQVTFDRQ